MYFYHIHSILSNRHFVHIFYYFTLNPIYITKLHLLFKLVFQIKTYCLQFIYFIKLEFYTLEFFFDVVYLICELSLLVLIFNKYGKRFRKYSFCKYNLYRTSYLLTFVFYMIYHLQKEAVNMQMTTCLINHPIFFVCSIIIEMYEKNLKILISI